jgi:putative peptidoglycan lipid II flippase
VKPFGAPGLVLATVGVNFVSVLMLLWFLDRKLNGLPLKAWSLPIAGLAVISGMSGLAAWGTLQGLAQVWQTGSGGFWLQLTQVCLAGLVGLLAFALLVSQLRIPEVAQFSDRIWQKVRRS